MMKCRFEVGMAKCIICGKECPNDNFIRLPDGCICRACDICKTDIEKCGYDYAFKKQADRDEIESVLNGGKSG
jgi:hypothetical protein